MFAADVAVEDQDEIAQDSSCMLGHSQGTFCRVAGFRIDTTAPAVGLSRVPQKTTKTTLHTIWYRICLFLAARTRKKKQKKQRLVLVPARTAGKLLPRSTQVYHEKNQIQPSGTTF